ncbi:MAG: FAD-binding oxidoreductase, partial [Alphaproteobacteria bacterium]|nr:FAD-binding oxidoreductase [Alphaproteobacteria bacterium]
GIAEPGCADIDVAAMHHFYLAQARRNGAELRCRATLEQARFNSGLWKLRMGQDMILARTLVNAAGAWADNVAERCGLAPLGIIPYRRTMVQARLARPIAHPLPLVIALDGSFYVKSEGSNRIWFTPHDETASPACDAMPEEMAVAQAMARLEATLDWRVARIERRWAGLRSFAPDRLPVYGYDTDVPSFYWFAGQGGFGIQTAPAAAKLALAELTGTTPDPMVVALNPVQYRPERLRAPG